MSGDYHSRSRQSKLSDVRFSATEGLLLRHFEDEVVVFQPLSWDVHVLNPAATAILSLLMESPHSEEEIADFLSDALEPEQRRLAAEHSRRILGDLCSLGVVQQT